MQVVDPEKIALIVAKKEHKCKKVTAVKATMTLSPPSCDYVSRRLSYREEEVMVATLCQIF